MLKSESFTDIDLFILIIGVSVTLGITLSQVHKPKVEKVCVDGVQYVTYVNSIALQVDLTNQPINCTNAGSHGVTQGS